MNGLRQEKEGRRIEGYKPGSRARETVAEAAAQRPGRRKINLAELELIERRANGAQVEARAPRRRRQRTMEMQAPTLQTPAAPSMGGM